MIQKQKIRFGTAFDTAEGSFAATEDRKATLAIDNMENANELTEEALIIHEKDPLKDKTVPYDQITEYHMVRRRFGSDKPGLARDFYLAYQIGKKRRVAILSPQDGDGFAAEFKKVTGKRWEL